jgi:hypothetical protein
MDFYQNGRHCFIGPTPTRDIGDLLAQRLALSDNHFKSVGSTRDDVTSYMDEADLMFDRRSAKMQRSRAMTPKSGTRTMRPREFA